MCGSPATTLKYADVDTLPAFILGASDAPYPLTSRAANRLAALKLVSQAKRSLDISSRALDPSIYDDAELVAAVKTLCLRSRRSRIRILVQDPTSLVSHGHRLVELAIRLSSFLELRRPDPEQPARNDAFLIADATGVLYLRQADRYEGEACFNDRKWAAELLRAFEEMWQHAQPDPNFRRLGI